MGNQQSTPQEITDLRIILDQIEKESALKYEGILSVYQQFVTEFPLGYITQEEFVKNMVMKYNDESVIEFAEHLFRSYDLNGSGEIDFREFLITVEMSTTGSISEKLLWVFDLFDVNGNGVLSNSEITLILYSIMKISLPDKELCQTAAENLAAEIFSCIDKNEDELLNFAEFSEGALQTPMIRSFFKID